MNGVAHKQDSDPRQQLFNCNHADCGATFQREWRLKEHETVHTGAQPFQCNVADCGRRFSRKSHLSRHALGHTGVKQFRCTFEGCTEAFFTADKLKRHVHYAHGEKDKYFKCNFPNCLLTFKKRRVYKLHLKEHGISSNFKCSKRGCGVTFDTNVARKAHEKKHAGYLCTQPECNHFEQTWGKMHKHMAKHPATFTCKLCQKVFKHVDSLRRHKRTHALRKPVLLCPSSGCKAYFSTTFNLQHHIRKAHLQLLKYHCCFPDCPRTFAMRESLSRHLAHHDPDANPEKKKRKRPKKAWQKRLEGHQLPLVEDDLRRLFALRMRVSRRAKVEVNLSGLFNERKIPHFVDSEVNLRDLFSIKPPHSSCPTERVPVEVTHPEVTDQRLNL
uniref:P43 5S RNA-binding protein-like n=1 Tax=Oncorhynchus gorbuscha TaxID=8017 RepID=UPI001EAF4E9E|nr:P43 5S RNA-binding protein-like [Oncorhynchus gorbuscha]